MSNSQSEPVVSKIVVLQVILFSLIFLAIILSLGAEDEVVDWFCQYEDAKTGQTCFRHVISEFQTLLTGIFAVVAAYATVQAMLHTDSKAEKRHSQLVGLSIRPSALLFDKYYKSLFPILEKIRDDLINFDMIGLPQLKKDGYSQDKLARISESKVVLNSASRILLSLEFKNVYELFDGDTTLLMLNSGNLAQKLEGKMNFALQAMEFANVCIKKLNFENEFQTLEDMELLNENHDVVTLRTTEAQVVDSMVYVLENISELRRTMTGFLLELEKLNSQYKKFSAPV